MGAVRRLSLAFSASLCVLVGALALPGTPAFALAFHKYESQFTEIPAEGPNGEKVPLPGPLVDAHAMTVDSGSLFVAEDDGNRAPRLDEFNASTQAFITQFHSPPFIQNNDYVGVAVGHGMGKRQVYVAERNGVVDSGQVAVYGESSQNAWSYLRSWTGPEPSTTFGEVRGVAIDNSSAPGDWAAGDVYVSDSSSSIFSTHPVVVDVFKPEANGEETLVTQIDGTGPGKPFGFLEKIAVDETNGDVLIVNKTELSHNDFESAVDVFEPEANMPGVYNLVKILTGPAPGKSFNEITDIAVDGGSGLGAGDIYVAETVNVPETFKNTSRVYDFSTTGELLDTNTGKETPAGSFETSDAVAVEPVSHHVFVADRHQEKGSEPAYEVVDVLGPLEIIPDVVSEPVSNIKFESEPPGSWGARFNGMVNPVEAGEVTSCGFVWGTSAAFGRFAECTVPKFAGGPGHDSAVAVRSNVSGLEPGTTYFYRLQAANALGTNEGEASQDVEFTTPGPGLDGESVSDIASSSATLEAKLNPHLAATSYYFQYGRTSEYGSEAPLLSASDLSGASLGSGGADVVAAQHVQGLGGHTVYHYRVVVSSEVEVSAGKRETLVFYGPDQTFTTQTGGGTLALLDGRAWEQVSPVDKHGGRIFGLVSGSGQRAPTQAAADGSGMTYGMFVPSEDEPQGYTSVVPVLSRRGTDGWSSVDLATPRDADTPELISPPEYQFVSEDLSRSFLVPFGGGAPLLSEEASELTPYIRSRSACEPKPTAEGCYKPLLTGKDGYADVPPTTVFGPAVEQDREIDLDGATPDLEHVLLNSSVALTGASLDAREVYEWSAGKPADEALQLVSVLPPSEAGGMTEVPDPGSAVGAGTDPHLHWSGARYAISDDGSRVFWGDGTRLFMRDTVKKETIRLDLPQPGASGAGNPTPVFQVANSEGSKVFFTDPQSLTAQSGKRTGAVYGDLYECEIVQTAGKDECKLSDLTPEYEGQSAEVQNIVSGASEEGGSSYVYFVANGALAPGATPGDCGGAHAPPPSATCNLYASHDGALTLIASLSAEDEFDWGGWNNVFHDVGFLTARASPDGRYLAFMSDRSLTGYDNHDAKTGRPDEEVYLYDAESDKLVCASCNPTGARPVGVEVGQITATGDPDLAAVLGSDGGTYGPQTMVAANVPGGDALGSYGESLYQSRYLSNSGRLFFNSGDALVPLDVNGREDVYEYEPAGVGPSGAGCSVSSSSFGASSGGCVDLISSGTSAEESGFLDASASGNDVFFLSSEKLVARDQDTAFDVYDARVCTAAEPCASELVAAPACMTPEACRTASSAQPPVFGSPASATFSGTGNLTARVPSTKTTPAKPKSRPLRRAQKLAKALRVCRKKKGGKRAVCERYARKRYRARSARKTSAKKKRGRG